jgi:hypothetical protein
VRAAPFGLWLFGEPGYDLIVTHPDVDDATIEELKDRSPEDADEALRSRSDRIRQLFPEAEIRQREWL